MALGPLRAHDVGRMRDEEQPSAQAPGPRRRGLLQLLLVVLVVVTLLVWQSQRIGKAQVHVRLGSRAAAVVRLELVWREAESGDVAFDSAWRLDAPREDLYQELRLRPGPYEVAVRIVGKDGREELSAVRATIEKDRPVEIDLDAPAAR